MPYTPSFIGGNFSQLVVALRSNVAYYQEQIGIFFGWTVRLQDPPPPGEPRLGDNRRASALLAVTGSGHGEAPIAELADPAGDYGAAPTAAMVQNSDGRVRVPFARLARPVEDDDRASQLAPTPQRVQGAGDEDVGIVRSTYYRHPVFNALGEHEVFECAYNKDRLDATQPAPARVPTVQARQPAPARAPTTQATQPVPARTTTVPPHRVIAERLVSMVYLYMERSYENHPNTGQLQLFHKCQMAQYKEHLTRLSVRI